MRVRELAVSRAMEFTPEVFRDDRGAFASPFQEERFVEAVGRPLFPVAQASISLSRRGVVRGVHFTRTPPGTAKYVYCPQGVALDIVVDLREGSPTFGQWDTVELGHDKLRATYLPTGVGHAFVALREDTVMSYLLSGSYIPSNELAISVRDPELALPVPEYPEPVLSQRDRAAQTLEGARAAGILPRYADCLRLDVELGSHTSSPHDPDGGDDRVPSTGTESDGGTPGRGMAPR